MCHYKLTSTVILHMDAATEALGNMNLSGNLTRQVEVDMPVEGDASHVANVGKMIEDMEGKMRNLLQEVYFGKAKDVVADLRSKCNPNSKSSGTLLKRFLGLPALSEANRDRATHREMISSMSK